MLKQTATIKAKKFEIKRIPNYEHPVDSVERDNTQLITSSIDSIQYNIIKQMIKPHWINLRGKISIICKNVGNEHSPKFNNFWIKVFNIFYSDCRWWNLLQPSGWDAGWNKGPFKLKLLQSMIP